MAAGTPDRVDVVEIQDLLLERSKVLEFVLAGLENETGGVGAHSAAPGHPAELASDASEQDVMYGRMESQSDELMEVREALERLEKGGYGDCESCGDPIPLERLRAIPYARLCVGCKSAEEEDQAEGTRNAGFAGGSRDS